jgi:hypothetical protein
LDEEVTTLIGDMVVPRILERKKKQEGERRLDLQVLAQDQAVRQKYQEALSRHMQGAGHQGNAYDTLRQAVKKACTVVPDKPHTINGRIIFQNDEEINRLKRLKCERRNVFLSARTVQRKRAAMRELKRIRHDIKLRSTQLLNRYYDGMAATIEQFQQHQRGYEAARILQVQSRKTLALKSEDGSMTTNAAQLIPLVNQFYKEFYNQAGIDKVERWTPQDNPRELEQPFTPAEINKAKFLLRNNRAAGKDKIRGEMLKYGGDVIDISLANMYNRIFSHREELPAMCEGVLIPLNKPGKEPIAKNTRPNTLLNMVRKILSIAVLKRIQPHVSAFVSTAQCGFRPNRSTAEVVWTYRWMIGIAERFGEEFNIMGIDMSKAFDCINRSKLLEVLETFIPLNEVRIIRYLLTETTLEARIAGQMGEKMNTTIGTPQGDALSPVMFIIYLEAALRVYRANLKAQQDMFSQFNQLNPYPSEFNMETAYADDVDFIKSNRVAHNPTENCIGHVLGAFNLVVNNSKTEFIDIAKGTEIVQKKLGSMINPSLDIKYRIAQSVKAYNISGKVWRLKQLTSKTRCRLYNAFIYPHLIYNIGASAGRKSEMDSFDSHHRQQLRRVCHRYYHTNPIGNLKLYALTDTIPISVTASEQRMKLLGHILRQDHNTPGRRIISEFFRPRNQRGSRGRRRITLPHRIADDLKRADIPFESATDYQNLAALVQQRNIWRRTVERITKSCLTEEFRRLREKNCLRRGVIIISKEVVTRMRQLPAPAQPDPPAKRIRFTMHLSEAEEEQDEVVEMDVDAEVAVELP